ncbi:MAG: MoaD family protein [Actinobacteria bacterium]|nr:MoaD family protein [Actinomycetota bacterium]MCG2794320.1 MoaD family protein [Actinomycetes bacterium]MBU4240939.1 MoaD family protein [Actinomycetota bacterium]MBU4302110.1 MoaD family protein [Actinomycetota bacterium]MBU4385540.1 MoaD family protein [Actinomycetota bacterium]
MPTVKFYASLRKVTGVREADIPVGSVKEVLERLSSDYEGKLRRYLKISTILVNGKNVIHLKGKRTRLKPDDVVSIFPPLGGG